MLRKEKFYPLKIWSDTTGWLWQPLDSEGFSGPGAAKEAALGSSLNTVLSTAISKLALHGQPREPVLQLASRVLLTTKWDRIKRKSTMSHLLRLHELWLFWTSTFFFFFPFFLKLNLQQLQLQDIGLDSFRFYKFELKWSSGGGQREKKSNKKSYNKRALLG